MECLQYIERKVIVEMSGFKNKLRLRLSDANIIVSWDGETFKKLIPYHMIMDKTVTVAMFIKGISEYYGE